jgi:tetratricopeptide (TPR) repeat protein
MPPDALLTILVAITGTVFYAATKTADQRRKQAQVVGEQQRRLQEEVDSLRDEVNTLINQYGHWGNQLQEEHLYAESQECWQVLKDKYESVELFLEENPRIRPFFTWDITAYYSYCFMNVLSLDGNGDYEGAYQNAKELLEIIEPDYILYPETVVILCNSCHYKRNYKKELFYINQLLTHQELEYKEKRDPSGYINTLARLANYYYRQGDVDTATKYLQKAKAITKSQPLAMPESSYITAVEFDHEIREGRYDNALTLLNRLSPDSLTPLSDQDPFTWAHYRRLCATVALAQDKYQDAREYLDGLLEVAGNDKVFRARYLSTLLIYFSVIGATEQILIVEEQLYEAFAMLPDNTENRSVLWIGLIDSYYHQKRYLDCLNITKQLFDEGIAPVYEPSIWVMMTRCHHFLGTEDKARECWEQAVNHYADTRWRNTARDMSYDDFVISPFINT